MNTRKAVIKAAKAHKANVKDERYWIKIAIRMAVDRGKECTTKVIYYTENLDWLKENGFKYHPYYGDFYYIISWSDKE